MPKKKKKKELVKSKDEKVVKPKVYKLKALPAEDRTFGQKAADGLTRNMGSWAFIILLGAFIVGWVYLNLTAYVNNWDPWPFIILNLVLSCLAAVQAPIILMSQKRAGQRDRSRAEYDYRINRRALKQANKAVKGIKYLRADLKQYGLKSKRGKARKRSKGKKARKKRKKSKSKSKSKK